MLPIRNTPFNSRDRFCLWVLIAFLAIGCGSAAWADITVAERKQTLLHLYVNARQAWEKWSESPATVHILDVRTPAEYIFVGHAPMAVNIPFTFLKNTVDPVTLRPDMPLNESFIADVKKRYKETDTILVMCRSGGRSAAAVNRMAQAGFQKVYNVIDGFEGDTLNDPASDDDGKRVVNGWKNSGAPWTYRLERELVYFP